MAKILLVDDESDCRRPLSILLSFEGYQIVDARNGLEGLQCLAQQSYDLVILDMHMPGVDGVAMLQSMRRQDRWARIPVLMVTGNHDPAAISKARQIGVQEYLFKGDTPFSKMLELVKRHLGESYTPRRRGRKPKVRPEAQVAPQPKAPRRPVPRFLELEFAETE